MSTNKKFRIQNGADIHGGGLSIDDVTVIDANGKVVPAAIEEAVAGLTAGDIADLQAQVSAILGTSPETLDTLQEIVAAFESADSSLTSAVAANTAAHTQNASDIAATNARTAGISTNSGSEYVSITAPIISEEQGDGLYVMDALNVGTEDNRYDLYVQGNSYTYGNTYFYGNGQNNSKTGIYTDYVYLGNTQNGYVKTYSNVYVGDEDNSKDLRVYGGLYVYGNSEDSIAGIYSNYVYLGNDENGYVKTYSDLHVGSEDARKSAYIYGGAFVSGDLMTGNPDVGYSAAIIHNSYISLGVPEEFINEGGDPSTVAIHGQVAIRGLVDPEGPSDAAHKGYVDSVKTALESADSALDAKIDALSATQSGDTSSLTSAIATAKSEAISTAAADATTKADQAESDAKAYADAQIAVETSARTSADTTLQSNIDTVSGRVDAILNGAGESLDTVVELVAAFENADSDIQALIASNSTSVTANQQAIVDEATARANADSDLSAGLSNETSRALSAEGVLTSDLSAEVARATAAESAETAARIAGDATLDAKVDALTTTEIAEGANQYFTQGRARGSVSGGTGVDYDQATGTFSADLIGGDGISVSGATISIDGTSIDQNLVPSVDNTYTLGSPDKVWKDVYIGPGSLYIGGQKVIEDNSGTITINADPNQNLTVQTAGTGNVSVQTTGSGSVIVDATTNTIDMKSDVVITNGKTISTTGGNATKFGGDVDMGGNTVGNVADPVADQDAANKRFVESFVNTPHTGDKTFTNNVTIAGSLTVQGTTTTVNSEIIKLADNLIDLNSNMTSGTPTENGGIRVMRGDESAAQLRWNETSDQWETYNGSSYTKIALNTGDLAEGSNLYYTEARVNSNVDPKIAAEASTRSTADQGLQSNIDAEEAARIAADATLQGAVEAEETARIAADTTERNARVAADSDLRSDLNSEIARAISAETVNAANIASEITARGNADAAIEADVIALQNQVSTLIGGAPGSLDTFVEIINAFEGADSDLQTVITSNSSRLTTAENNITALSADMTAEENARASADAAEQSARQAGDANLQAQITALTSSTDSDTSDLGDQISDEVAARIAGDAANSAEVSAEAVLRASADNALQASINSERDARVDGDSDLQSQITAEVNRATSAEAALQTSIDFVKENTDPAALDSLTEIVAAFQNADSNISGVVSSNTSRISALEGGVTAIEAWSTDNVSEGSTNLYFTEARARSCVSADAGSCINYAEATGKFSLDVNEANGALNPDSAKNADKLDGHHGSHYRINIYNVAGTLVN